MHQGTFFVVVVVDTSVVASVAPSEVDSPVVTSSLLLLSVVDALFSLDVVVSSGASVLESVLPPSPLPSCDNVEDGTSVVPSVLPSVPSGFSVVLSAAVLAPSTSVVGSASVDTEASSVALVTGSSVAVTSTVSDVLVGISVIGSRVNGSGLPQ